MAWQAALPSRTNTTSVCSPALNIENLNLTGTRLYGHADAIHNAARRDVERDLRLAARIMDRFASLRSNISDIAEKTKDPTTARDLRIVLDEAEQKAWCG